MNNHQHSASISRAIRYTACLIACALPLLTGCESPEPGHGHDTGSHQATKHRHEDYRQRYVLEVNTIDAWGLPVPAAWVSVSVADTLESVASGQTDAHGRVVFDILATAGSEVYGSVRADGFSDSAFATVAQPGADLITAEVTLSLR